MTPVPSLGIPGKPFVVGLAGYGLLAAVVGAGLALVPLACGGGGSKPVTEDSFCTQKAERECGQLEGSCQFDTSQCETVRKAACLAYGVTQATATRIFKPKNTSRCLSEVDQTMGRSSITAAQWQEMLDVCARVYEGDGESQAPCASPYDCVSGFICDKGFCAEQERVGATAFCTNPGEVCPEGAYCRYNAAAMPPNWGCVARGSTTQACDGANPPCMENLRCVSGMCGSRLANLAACTSDGDCTSGLCEPFQRVCVTDIRFSALSPACNAYLGALQMPDAMTTTMDAMNSADTTSTPGDAAAGN